MLASIINRVSITSANDDFMHSTYKPCSDHRTDTSLASSAAHKGGEQHGNICRVKNTHPVHYSNWEPWIHFCASPAVHSFIIIYFHQLETRKTHLRPLIMQTREPLCHTRTMHPKISVKCIWKKKR